MHRTIFPRRDAGGTLLKQECPQNPARGNRLAFIPSLLVKFVLPLKKIGDENLAVTPSLFRQRNCSFLRPLIAVVILGSGPIVRTAAAAPSSATQSRTITSTAELLDLTNAEAKKEYPVILHGVITLFDQSAGLCFVYDGSGSVYVYVTSPVELSSGDVVDITGVSGSGLFSPIAQRVVLTRIGRTNLPPAKPVMLDQMASGREDCQFVQVEGTIQKEWNENNNRYLKMGGGDGALEICLLQPDSAPKSLVDSKVRVQGVAIARPHNKMKRVETQLFVSTALQIQILEPGASEPFNLPVLHSLNLTDYSHRGRTEHRIHVRGTVLSPMLEKTLYIRDETGPIRVELDKAIDVVSAGEVVDCAGFAALRSSSGVILDAECKPTNMRIEVKALPVTFMQANDGKFDNDLVQMVATVIKIESSAPNVCEILLESDQHTFRAYLPISEKSLQVRARSKIAITGICRVSQPEMLGSERFRILGRGKRDLEILSEPSWWQDRGSPWVVGLSIAALAGVGSAAFAHRRVRKQDEEVKKREKALAQDVQKDVTREIELRTKIEHELLLREQQLNESIQERERIARDLHDGLIQSIYAIGLNIEDCTCGVPDTAPEVRAYLGKIKGDLNRVIEDVRNFILGIESSTVTGSEFKTALKSMVLTMTERQRGKARIDVDRRAAEELFPDQATQLLHVAREAMTNSLRHGDAGLVVLSLLRHGSHIRFEVRDNGKGFNANLPASRGLGLRNMAARAAEMGASYILVSEPGQGTRIVLDFQPKKSVRSSI
jgi:signal transduction histidine kinase